MRHLLLLILILAIGCSTDRDQEEGVEIPDNAFKYSGITSLRNENLTADYDEDKGKYSLTPLNDTQMSLLTDPLYGNERLYKAYFYSKQNTVGEAQPVLVYVDRGVNSTLVLFCLSKENTVLDHLELAWSFSDYDGSDENNPILNGSERYSEFLNNYTIRVTQLELFIEGYDQEDEVTLTDSTSLEYRIRESGEILLVKKDSVRYSRRTK